MKDEKTGRRQKAKGKRQKAKVNKAQRHKVLPSPATNGSGRGAGVRAKM